MTGSLSGFEVRAATGSDGPRMAELDRLAFGAAGMGHYGESHVRCWLEVNSEGLLVASRDGTAVACCLGLELIAPWYVAQCAALFGGARLWPGVKHQALALPPPGAPDPVLNKYLKDRGAEAAAVLVDWIEDPASCNCSALVAIPNPLLAP